MSDSKKKKKKYEAPIVKEIGGIFEQAMGASTCASGPGVSIPNCSNGNAATSCGTGNRDQGCAGGPAFSGPCSRGNRATTCTAGRGV